MDEMIWSPALSQAARHLANHEGSCGTYGDVYGNFIPHLLQKYYALTYEDLTILKLEGEDMGGDSDYAANAQAILEYILAQKHIDTSILKSETHLYLGIGCACSVENSYLCYIVSAKDVVAPITTEKLPIF